MDHKIENINVSDDHILLADIVEKNDITVKQLATLTGLAASSIYKYLAGICVIPTVIWRAVYKMTWDIRINQLVTGDVPQVIVPLVNVSKIKIDSDKFDSLVEMRQELIAFESEILIIITSDDNEGERSRAIEKLKQQFPKVISSQVQLFQAITGSYDFDKTAIS